VTTPGSFNDNKNSIVTGSIESKGPVTITNGYSADDLIRILSVVNPEAAKQAQKDSERTKEYEEETKADPKTPASNGSDKVQIKSESSTDTLRELNKEIKNKRANGEDVSALEAKRDGMLGNTKTKKQILNITDQREKVLNITDQRSDYAKEKGIESIDDGSLEPSSKEAKDAQMRGLTESQEKNLIEEGKEKWSQTSRGLYLDQFSKRQAYREAALKEYREKNQGAKGGFNRITQKMLDSFGESEEVFKLKQEWISSRDAYKAKRRESLVSKLTDGNNLDEIAPILARDQKGEPMKDAEGNTIWQPGKLTYREKLNRHTFLSTNRAEDRTVLLKERFAEGIEKRNIEKALAWYGRLPLPAKVGFGMTLAVPVALATGAGVAGAMVGAGTGLLAGKASYGILGKLFGANKDRREKKSKKDILSNDGVLNSAQVLNERQLNEEKDRRDEMFKVVGSAVVAILTGAKAYEMTEAALESVDNIPSPEAIEVANGPEPIASQESIDVNAAEDSVRSESLEFRTFDQNEGGLSYLQHLRKVTAEQLGIQAGDPIPDTASALDRSILEGSLIEKAEQLGFFRPEHAGNAGAESFNFDIGDHVIRQGENLFLVHGDLQIPIIESTAEGVITNNLADFNNAAIDQNYFDADARIPQEKIGPNDVPEFSSEKLPFGLEPGDVPNSNHYPVGDGTYRLFSEISGNPDDLSRFDIQGNEPIRDFEQLAKVYEPQAQPATPSPLDRVLGAENQTSAADYSVSEQASSYDANQAPVESASLPEQTMNRINGFKEDITAIKSEDIRDFFPKKLFGNVEAVSYESSVPGSNEVFNGFRFELPNGENMRMMVRNNVVMLQNELPGGAVRTIDTFSSVLGGQKGNFVEGLQVIAERGAIKNS